MKTFKTHVVALAIPSPPDEAWFIATTVSSREMEAYRDGHVDLRYLFTYPIRSIYTFDLMKMVDNKVMMEPFEDHVPEQYLPSPRFFSSSHTDDEEDTVGPTHIQSLVVDGEWDMPDFGQFYSLYSDVYYFLSAVHAFADESVEIEKKKTIKQTFVHTPFKGGFSYVHFYTALPAIVPRNERLRMDKIKYESPGYVDVSGDSETFAETESIILSFLNNRAPLRELYNTLHSFLSKKRYLVMAAEEFSENAPASEYINQAAATRAETRQIRNTETVRSLVKNNPLAFAKIVLSLYRRLDEASRFFAQGRVNFT
ncbi:hypothetical protein I6F35_13165 [Bradyrhizobium sp. BRP22]|uniref:hypothetical protein n=1 Tax=Bradyrhizobium sp. BRP22 TaxID=2793821 RepID=UPI001CD24145|nr:hypothetical protein [Bradyrhizobium sp. BRP22]MCA1454159.1 hypothetical protein [Bradyrhizobium sp. BRP22]